MKIKIIIPSPNFLRTDIPNWDTYGASSALSDELTTFDARIFEKATGAIIGKSLDQKYSWAIEFAQVSIYPRIVFLSDKNVELGVIQGTPKLRGEVAGAIQSIIDKYKIKPSSGFSWAFPIGLLLLVGATIRK